MGVSVKDKTHQEQSTFETLRFNSKDGLPITADYYAASRPRGFILLCHRSHCNRGEYRETAPQLTPLGFSCLAIDQRSGMKVFGVTNETSAIAKQKGLPTGYLDARQDIDAAVDYAYEINDSHPIILFGSSYSASLALLIAAENNKVKAVIAFSPGEHLKNVRVAEEIHLLAKPIFATAAKKEIEDVNTILRAVDPNYVTVFNPPVDGFHGSKALWGSVEGHDLYWQALRQFLTHV
jgi:alpha-beta hydrolase superfamily lysophospholipase